MHCLTKPVGFAVQEAVMSLLARALQYCNQKRLYLAVLAIFQRTKKEALSEQILKVRPPAHV
jgi:hypothetical protein